jgi:ABC-type sugar transport system ATPase subunit
MSLRVTGLIVHSGAFQLGPLDLQLASGEYLALMGRTGCGKSTTLEAVAGLRTPVAGRIWIADQEVTALAPGLRGVGYVPQDLALFPTLTVEQNLAFGLTLRRQPWQSQVTELAHWLGISHLLQRRVTSLSGGEAQRTALGRALAIQPKLLLLDEPFSALDEETRKQMYQVMRQVRQRTGVTVLHVTHSRAEADELSDRRLVLA